jgi:micrococcal nuclease
MYLRKTKLLISFYLILSFTSTSCLCLAHASSLKPWSGEVVGVSDGDTIKVLKNGRAVKIRLAEIDCPESGQDFGKVAKRETSKIYGSVVNVRPVAKDRYRRVVAHIYLEDGTNWNEHLVAVGLAWQYKYYSKSQRLNELERNAKASKIGLWRAKSPVPPWKWRRNKR